MDATRSRYGIWAGVIALLALHVGLALWAAAKETVTSDEIFHVTGGYFYNKYGDYRVQPENGNLPQRVAGLPAVLMGAPTPPLADNIYWKTSDGQVISHQLFYETGHDHWPMFMAGRALMMIFSIGTGLLVFGWARSLFGTAAGFLSLTLYALCPNILAHAPLTTSDLAAVFFFLASVGAYWRHLRAPSWGNTTLSGAVFGLAYVAKYSAVLLLPMMLMLLAWRIWHDPPAERSRWWKLAPLSLAGHAALGTAAGRLGRIVAINRSLEERLLDVLDPVRRQVRKEGLDLRHLAMDVAVDERRAGGCGAGAGGLSLDHRG